MFDGGVQFGRNLSTLRRIVFHLSSGRKSKVRRKRQFKVWWDRRTGQSAEHRDSLKSRECIQNVPFPTANSKSPLLVQHEVRKMRATAYYTVDWISLKMVTVMSVETLEELEHDIANRLALKPRFIAPSPVQSEQNQSSVKQAFIREAITIKLNIMGCAGCVQAHPNVFISTGHQRLVGV